MKKYLTLAITGGVVLLSASAMHVSPSAAHHSGNSCGTASWYGGKFHGRKTANGETYNMNQLTAAHRTLPFGTKLRVTNKRNGNSVVVRINDRGPFIKGRTIDLSKAAASKIGMIRTGHAPICFERIG